MINNASNDVEIQEDSQTVTEVMEKEQENVLELYEDQDQKVVVESRVLFQNVDKNSVEKDIEMFPEIEVFKRRRKVK